MIGRYFDYNATTPLADEVKEVMVSAMSQFGNPSSMYRLGKEAKHNLEMARELTARLIGTTPERLYFTSGGSESNTLALIGYLQPFKHTPGHLITTSTEHPSVLDVFRFLESHYGFSVTFLPVNGEGLVDVNTFASHLRPDTQLISIMLANNETGAIQPIRHLAQIAQKFERSTHSKSESGIFFHTDATQAIGKMCVNVHELSVDALSFSAHKFYGPKGVGGLFIKDRETHHCLIHGGGQERGLRGGTENTINIMGMGKAAELLLEQLMIDTDRYNYLRGVLEEQLQAKVPNVKINGPLNAASRLANTLNIQLPGLRGESVAALLNELYGFSVSIGSACSSNKNTEIVQNLQNVQSTQNAQHTQQTQHIQNCQNINNAQSTLNVQNAQSTQNNQKAQLSHVLQAMGLSEDEIKSSIRISFGRYTSEADICEFVSSLQHVSNHLTRLLPTTLEVGGTR